MNRLAFVGLWLALACAASDPEHVRAEEAAASVSTGDGTATSPDGLAPEGTLLALGESDPKLHLVRRGRLWSMHAENLVVAQLFDYWRTVGGPDVVSKLEIVDPYTFSVHGLTAERIVARLLDGYGYTLHYASDGRLERVRVYSPEPTRSFKTPRLVESLGKWREIETALSAPASAQAPGGSDTAPSPEAAPAP